MITKKELDVIDEDDFEALLVKAGLQDAYTNGKIVCSRCGCIINKDNIAFIYFKQNYKFVCDNPKCMNRIER